MVVPLIALLRTSWVEGHGRLGAVLTDPAFGVAVAHWFELSAAATLISVLVGVAIALALRDPQLPGRAFWRVAVLLPVLIPDFVLAYSWLRAYARAGLTTDLFGFAWTQIQGPVEVSVIVASQAVPLVYLITTVGLPPEPSRPRARRPRVGHFRVPRFQILDQHGKTMTIVGELAVHQRQAGAVNISIDSDDFKLFDNELGDLHIESHLKLTGDVRKPKLEGEVRADAARVEIDKVLLAFATPYAEEALPDVVSADQGTAASTKGADETTKQALEQGREASQRAGEETVEAESKPSSGPLTALALDVHFVAADNVVVRGQSLRPGGPTAAQIGSINTTVGADVQVQKAAGSTITLRGTVNTVRGFYEFQGRRFEIVRDGTVRFLGLPEINPQLDITAQRLIPNSGVTAIIHVTGRMRSPQLALTSTPPLDEADILSLILFNRSVNDLGTGERASLAETAGGIASGFVASPLSRSIGKALDVDLFEITTSDPQTGETAGGVTLGKQVSDKAFVRFRQQFGQRSFTEFMIEYRLATFLRLDATVAPETSAAANRLTQQRVERGGVDLIFFFSY